MSPLTTVKYGRKILRTEANLLYKRFFKIKKESSPEIKNVIRDAEALRYYCGRDNRKPEQEDIAYLFDMESIHRLLKLATDQKADGIVIFHGARPEEKTDLDEKSGRPTLMLFPYKQSESTSNNGEPAVTIVNLLDEGEEHPGTGGQGDDGDGGGSGADQQVALPDRFPPDEHHAFNFKLFLK